MSTQSKALGSRENFWYDENTPLEELQERPLGDLNVHELRRLARETTPFNLDVDVMAESELRKWIRDRRENPDRPSECVTDYERARWKAHKVLREVSTPISKTAKHAPPNRGWTPAFALVFEHYEGVSRIYDHDPLAIHTERCEVELTDACEHVPREYDGDQFGVSEYGQKRFRRRYDPEHGYLGGVDFEDLEMSKFMPVVEAVLQDLQAEHSFRQSKVDGWLEDAMELKRNENMTDQDALTQVLFRIFVSTRD